MPWYLEVLGLMYTMRQTALHALTAARRNLNRFRWSFVDPIQFIPENKLPGSKKVNLVKFMLRVLLPQIGSFWLVSLSAINRMWILMSFWLKRLQKKPKLHFYNTMFLVQNQILSSKGKHIREMWSLLAIQKPRGVYIILRTSYISKHEDKYLQITNVIV